MKQTSVLFLVNDLEFLYTLRLEMVERLLQEGANITISAPYKDRVSYFKNLGCNFFQINFSKRGLNPFSDLVLLYNYYKLIKRINPDVVLTYTIKSNIYGGLACRFSHTPQLANMTGLGDGLMHDNWVQRVVLVLLRMAFKRTKVVFLQNQTNYQYFLDHRISTESQCRLIRGSGVSLTRHPFEAFPEETDGVKLLFIGRILRDKGVDELIAAGKMIHSNHPDFRCDIAGFYVDDSYKTKLSAYEESGAGSYLGFRKDIHQLIKQYHAIVLPSYHEGMANVLLEAAACGRPVLASNVPGCRETFDEGISGIGFEPRSVDALTQAIARFIALPHEDKVAMGLAGRKKVENEFDRQIIIDTYMEEIGKIIAPWQDKDN
ncbi:MAG: glycosyltransferase family 4 protein [Sphaerochaeta sp.]|nr:glycosyltransferase family 4 protein [Sphaerochaeta sp.]MDY0243472.1 glycosyltransferase family 4 protein [Sphaerochaeta sp.]